MFSAKFKCMERAAQNGLDLIPGIGDAGDRLYLGAMAAEIAPPPDEVPPKKSKT